MHTRSRVNADNPQAAHISLAGSPVAIHICHRTHHRFVRWPEKTLTRTTMAFSHLQYFFMFLVRCYATFHSRHGKSSIRLFLYDWNINRHKEEDVSYGEYRL